jgi:hypothetical protein
MKLTKEETLKAVKLLLAEEVKKNFRLKDSYEQFFGKPFDENGATAAAIETLEA